MVVSFDKQNAPIPFRTCSFLRFAQYLQGAEIWSLGHSLPFDPRLCAFAGELAAELAAEKIRREQTLPPTGHNRVLAEDICLG